MIWLIYDGSFEGLLTVVFETFEFKWKEVRIRKKGAFVPQLFAEEREVITDEKKAVRVWKKLVELLRPQGVKILWKAWLSEMEAIEESILGVVNYAIALKRNVLADFGNLHVLNIQKIVKSVDREKHRMEAFVRFQLTKDGIYFSVINPDFNVLPLVLKHFENRYADQRWFIFDTRRNYGIYYNLEKAEFTDFFPNELIASDLVSPTAFEGDEFLYQTLWKDYFQSTNIAARKNTKLHVQHVPKRYWKYLVEKV